ncbi:mechanosensitive ion channel domain-containing protein [endosymbiont of Pachyrhynchus infernalis]|uniref:mechanosensitive ion channel domain-containing protein n=1 Tax=endosymbiont of Pachyrhynchus infernalis TaxID=1971488 RepID=UPI000DC710A2|nr:mechanosensitive ion channel domain-containing protein [endosymbiont of Pachyrhynchus infernalis]BBA84861.1 mechanosensitive channel [endosymbiont of Pachyrhynchus infernalis]
MNNSIILNKIVNYKLFLFNYIYSIFLSISFLLIGVILSNLVSKFLNKIMEYKNIDKTAINFVSTTIKYSVIILFSIISLNKIGVETTSIVTILGAAGLAIGLALQNSLSNFAAGILLVGFRHFKINDYIDIGGGILGFIVSVQLFSTTLRTLDGKIVIVPNSKILSGNIINLSSEPLKLISTCINIDRSSDIKLAKLLIQDSFKYENRISKNHPTFIIISSITYTSIEITIRFWTSRENSQFVISNILEIVNTKFKENKIFPPRYVLKIINLNNIK